MAYKIKRQLISSETKDYGYGLTEKEVYKVMYRGFTFQEMSYHYHEYATDDELDYDERGNDCFCFDTNELIGENEDNYYDAIINYVKGILNK